MASWILLKCNSLLYGLPRNNSNKLQRPQNVAARLVANTPIRGFVGSHLYCVSYTVYQEVLGLN